ncbi:FGGY family carbohydrate kinase [Microbacterium terrisoli]|uniref:FGGY family carbohydrate kinase n=1 Tax=Microbacterium terrisoli TaxID=3242192 RepID=UPI0028052813|nr:FGGY family carbohydrate kinase [Microbacterium protaetiae]
MTIALGLDLGSTTTKAVLVDVADGCRVLRVGRAATPDDVPALRDTVGRLLRDIAADAQVAAVGIASMAETGVALDEDGTALTPLLRWDRTHTHAAHARLRTRHPHLPERTGIPDTPKPALVVLHGLRERAPEVLTRMRRWQGVADLAAAALTGAHATDHTLAARTMMLDPDAPQRRWDAALLAELGLAPEVLPGILAPGEPAGRAGGAFGLPAGVPVYIAGHDHAVGAWAAGARQVGDVADSLGTAEAVMAITEHVDTAAAVRDGFSVGRTVDDLHATVMGGNAACGALLVQWPDSPLPTLAAQGTDTWSTSPVTVLPYPRGRQCPHPNPNAHLRVLGTPIETGDLERGILQSLVLHSRWMRTAMQRHTGMDADRIVLFGSLTERIPAWAPLTAAAGRAHVRRCTATEPVAAGAALLAAVRAGLAADTLVLDTVESTPSASDGLEAAYDRFLAAALDP